MAGGSDNQDTKGPVWVRLGYDEKTDQKKDIRNPLLVVAALIAAVTFQAGVDLPDGDWKKDDSVPFYVFVTFNTLALSTSILILISLTFRFPLSIETVVATLSMFATYASAIFAVASEGSLSFRFLLIIFLAPFIIRALLEIFRSIRGKYCASSGIA